MILPTGGKQTRLAAPGRGGAPPHLQRGTRGGGDALFLERSHRRTQDLVEAAECPRPIAAPPTGSVYPRRSGSGGYFQQTRGRRRSEVGPRRLFSGFEVSGFAGIEGVGTSEPEREDQEPAGSFREAEWSRSSQDGGNRTRFCSNPFWVELLGADVGGCCCCCSGVPQEVDRAGSAGFNQSSLVLQGADRVLKANTTMVAEGGGGVIEKSPFMPKASGF